LGDINNIISSKEERDAIVKEEKEKGMEKWGSV
jgi:hypothetical protein